MAENHFSQNAIEEAKVGAGQLVGSATSNLLRDESFGSRSMLERMTPAVKAFGEAARELRMEVMPHMQKQAAGLRAISPEFGAFPLSAVHRAKAFGADVEMSSSAGRWGFLNSTQQKLMQREELAGGMWKTNPRLLANGEINADKFALATNGATRAGFRVENYNARAFEMNDLVTKHDAAHWSSVRATIRNDLASIIVGQGANLALDQTVFRGVEKSNLSTALDMWGGMATMATRIGFLGKTASLIGVHVGARLYDAYQNNLEKK